MGGMIGPGRSHSPKTEGSAIHLRGQGYAEEVKHRGGDVEDAGLISLERPVG